MVIDLPTAKAHLRLDPDYPNEQVVVYLRAAEMSAAQFLNRRIFADATAANTAVAAVPSALVSAGLAHESALAAAAMIDDPVARCAAVAHAERVYRQAQADAAETYGGIVTNELINAAILLTLGHLFENRQENFVGVTVAELKLGVQRLLFPFRVGLGV